MAPVLYTLPQCPPGRSIEFTAKLIGLKLELKYLDLAKNEHKTPEFLKINPQHTLPTLVDDDGFILWDSHAIMVYLISKYAKDDSLYPKDVKQRAIINQRLHFNSGVYWARFLAIINDILHNGAKTIKDELGDRVLEALGFLNTFLEGNKFVAGNSLTIADLSLLSATAALGTIFDIDQNKFPNVVTWLKGAEKLAISKELQEGVELFGNIFKPMLK